MKIEKIDYVWVGLSWLIVFFSFYNGILHFGILIIYGLMVLLFGYHIFQAKKRMKNTVAAFGTVTGYHTAERGRLYYPIVCFETEDGREINSVYTIAAREKRYDEGSVEMICYDPDAPMFFYFANREEDMTGDYYRYIIFGAVAALILFVLAKAIF